MPSDLGCAGDVLVASEGGWWVAAQSRSSGRSSGLLSPGPVIAPSAGSGRRRTAKPEHARPVSYVWSGSKPTYVACPSRHRDPSKGFCFCLSLSSEDLQRTSDRFRRSLHAQSAALHRLFDREEPPGGASARFPGRFTTTVSLGDPSGTTDPMPPTVVTFGLSPSYGIRTAREALAHIAFSDIRDLSSPGLDHRKLILSHGSGLSFRSGLGNERRHWPTGCELHIRSLR